MLILVSHTSGNTASKLWNRFADSITVLYDSITVSLFLHYAYQRFIRNNSILDSITVSMILITVSHAGWHQSNHHHMQAVGVSSLWRGRGRKNWLDHGASQAASIFVYQFHVLLRVEYGRQSGWEISDWVWLICQRPLQWHQWCEGKSLV